MLKDLQKEIKKLSSKERAQITTRFFKTGKGEYGEGDIFIGVRIPDTRKVAKNFLHIDTTSLKELLTSPIHEERLCALIILVHKFEKNKEESAREKIVKLYLKHMPYINNWDLVDLSAAKILGAFLIRK